MGVQTGYAFDALFPRYERHDPLVPVWCVTPGMTGVIHRFYDTCPISPSGRYLALTRFPFEDRLPQPGEAAEVVLVDLADGSARTAAVTRGWDTQLGAQVQWGRDDTELYFNDVDVREWRAFGVRLNPFTGETRAMEGTVYMLSPDGKRAVSPCLQRTGATQPGYGVRVPATHVPRNSGAAADDGVYVTDTESGRSRLLLSFRDIARAAQPPIVTDVYGPGAYYGFHTKWNCRGDKIMFVIRYKMDQGGFAPMVVTMNADGSCVRTAVPASEWKGKGGNHPNWLPGCDAILMNLKYDGKTMRFVTAGFDGSGYGMLRSDVVGSGHPTMHPDGRWLVTDAYLKESAFARADGTTPIRVVDMACGNEFHAVRIRTQPDYAGPNNELRVDPHPAWCRNHRYIVFNACPEGKRQVFIADLSAFVGGGERQ